ncbi:MAG: AI-2E family transporter, partial [Muribaculaceae bacterium]|nr:AI-2E family transporter [Muribaculaceae bacterium]
MFWTRDRIMWLIISVVVGCGVIWVLNRLSNVLLPFFAACLIAYLLNPIVNFFQRKVRIRNRLLAVIVTLLVVAGVLVGLGWLCAPLIAKEIDTLTALIERYSSQLTSLHFLPVEIREYLNNLDLQKFSKMLNPQYMV